jgi:hypothetical protein
MKKKKVKIYCNLVYGNWSPRDLETGIGGSEEKLIEFARYLVGTGKYAVEVYMVGEHGVFDGVRYIDRKQFASWDQHDIFISFKEREILKESINARKIFHWTTEIEPEWPGMLLGQVDTIWTLSKYHTSRMGNLSAKRGNIPKFEENLKKFRHQYLWADLERLDRNKSEKKAGTMLYSSSFDRGLEELLKKWTQVKKALGLEKLYITYGWAFMDRVLKGRQGGMKWKEEMQKLMEQEGVEYLGQLTNDEMCKIYWKCQYWCLPLNNPGAELFCINAIKAQYCRATPVVRKVGALQETVNEYIDWDRLIAQTEVTEVNTEKNRMHAEKFGMKRRIDSMLQDFARLEK